MKIYYNTKNTQNQQQFWKQYIENQTPDFYITGMYSINSSFTFFYTENVKLKANNFDFELKNAVVKNTSTKINKKQALYLLKFQTVNDISEMAKYISLQIGYQSNIKNIKLYNFVYEPTQLASQFSYKLTSELLYQLNTIGNYNISELKFLCSFCDDYQ